jgi:hypothetical protein
MSDASTIKMIDSYLEESTAPPFFAGFFRSPPVNFHDSEEVEFDIQRDSETVAVTVADISVPANQNAATVLTNKKFKPPIFKEAGPITAFDLIARAPGQNPFQDPNYAANAVRQSFGIFRKLELKIRRAIELMASQVFLSGQLTLINNAGATVFTMNFSPKATHFVTPTAWAADGSTGDPLANIAALGTVLRRDGKREPNKLIFGEGAFLRFQANPKVKEALNSRRAELTAIVPQSRGAGATFQGWIWVGHYRYEIWTYDGFYQHQQTGAFTAYLPDNKVIMMSDQARLDLTFGNIPQLVRPDARVMPYLPPRIASEGRGLDLITNAWVTPDGTTVMVEAACRPLTIPTEIDTFGCLTVF